MGWTAQEHLPYLVNIPYVLHVLHLAPLLDECQILGHTAAIPLPRSGGNMLPVREQLQDSELTQWSLGGGGGGVDSKRHWSAILDAKTNCDSTARSKHPDLMRFSLNCLMCLPKKIIWGFQSQPWISPLENYNFPITYETLRRILATWFLCNNRYPIEVPYTLTLASVMPGSPYSIMTQDWYQECLFAWTSPQRELEIAPEKLILKLFGPSGKSFLNTVNSWNCKFGWGGTGKSS